MWNSTWKDKILDYEIETSTKWRDMRGLLTWKDKILDYEIETKYWVIVGSSVTLPWKDKILDYEIETQRWWWRRWWWFAWKDKILDYEIETLKRCHWKFHIRPLEKIRFSITRLKLKDWLSTKSEIVPLEKIRFSITRLKLLLCPRPNTYRDVIGAWKDKILDYEIETLKIVQLHCPFPF